MPNTLAKRVTFDLLSPILAMLLILGLSLSAFAQTKPQVDLTGKNVPIQGSGVSGALGQSHVASKKVLILHPPEGRQIILCTGVKDDRVRVTVRDFGPGIDKESLERIFQSFFTTKGTGLGMGLSVCRSIVEAHGGHIWAENNPDRGATFVFEIPTINKQ